MKYSDKYPAPEDGGTRLPPASKVVGLHPLVWVFIVVMTIAGFAAFDHLKGARWGLISPFQDVDLPAQNESRSY